MKKLLFLSLIVTILYSCGSSGNKKTSYTITDWMVAGITNPNTGDGALGWARMVVYKDSAGWKLNSNGDTIKVALSSDTFYLLQTPDYSCPVKDSTGKQVNNPYNHQPVYNLSWRNAAVIPKDMVRALYPYPERVRSGMIAAQPQPDSAYKAPRQVVVKDTARRK